jgi:hypothetical protein
MKEKALQTAPEKEGLVMGAKVSCKNLPKKYEYSGTKHKTLSTILEDAKQELKNHEKVLQLSDWINPSTGETETATLIPQEKTRTLTVTF